MRKLTFLVLILGALYSGYWFIGARSVENGALSAISDMQDAGWDVSYRDLQTIGFPSRFDTTITDLALTSVDGRWSWEAPFVQVFALSYQPNKVIAAFPPDHDLRLGDQTLTLSTDGLRASAAVRANTDLSFNSVTTEVGAVTIRSDFGWTTQMDRALVAVRSVDTPNAYDIYADLDHLTLPTAWLSRIDPGGQLAQIIDRIVLDGQVLLDQPVDRHVAAPLIQTALVNNAAIDWGDVSLRAAGSVDVDGLGVLDGRITVTTDDWRKIIDVLTTIGVIQPGLAPTLTNLANAMAQNGDTLELPISFQNGFMSVGPVPLGRAPRLR